MNSPPRHFGSVVIAAVLFTACRRHPERTPEGTLGLLRDALATGHPPMAQVADTRVIAEATSLDHALQIQERIGMPLTDHGFEQALRDSQADVPAQRFFAGVLTLLRNGHCERIGDGIMPDPIAHVPSPGEHWPAEMLRVQESVARRAQNAYAADYRCDGGPSFGAVFVRPEPNDGTWRVALIGPASHR